MTIQGEASTNIEAFRLKDADVQEVRRNFSGYQVNTYYNLADMQDGDYAGTTETDSATEKGVGGYTKINKKHGKSIL